MYYPPMKTIEQRRTWFADIIFKFPYKRLTDSRQKFIDYVSDQYAEYRKNIAAKGKEIRGCDMTKKEYYWIHYWFDLRIPPDCLMAAMEAGRKVYLDLRKPINSIGGFKNQVMTEYQNHKERLSAHLAEYEYRGYRIENLFKDKWFYNFFKKFHIAYSDQYYFDFYLGYDCRFSGAYVGTARGIKWYVLVDQNGASAKTIAAAAGIPGDRYHSEPFPHYRLTPTLRKLALASGAKYGDKEKIAAIIKEWKEIDKSSSYSAEEIKKLIAKREKQKTYLLRNYKTRYRQ